MRAKVTSASVRACVRTWALTGVHALVRVHVTARLTCMFIVACVCMLVSATACVQHS